MACQWLEDGRFERKKLFVNIAQIARHIPLFWRPREDSNSRYAAGQGSAKVMGAPAACVRVVF